MFESLVYLKALNGSPTVKLLRSMALEDGADITRGLGRHHYTSLEGGADSHNIGQVVFIQADNTRGCGRQPLYQGTRTAWKIWFIKNYNFYILLIDNLY